MSKHLLVGLLSRATVFVGQQASSESTNGLLRRGCGAKAPGRPTRHDRTTDVVSKKLPGSRGGSGRPYPQA